MPDCSTDIDGGGVGLAMSRLCTTGSRHQGYSSVDGLNATVVPHRIPPHVPFSMAPSKEAGMLEDLSAAENVFYDCNVFFLIILLSQLIIINSLIY